MNMIEKMWLLVDVPTLDYNPDIHEFFANIPHAYPVVVDAQAETQLGWQNPTIELKAEKQVFNELSWMVPYGSFIHGCNKDDLVHVSARVVCRLSQESIPLNLSSTSLSDLVRRYAKRRYCERAIYNVAYCSEGPALWRLHIEQVVKWVYKLAKAEGYEPSVAVIAAYLHDITRLDGDDATHQFTSSDLADHLLSAVRAPLPINQRVKEAILNHRGASDRGLENPDTRLLAAADGAATLQFYPLVYYASYRKHGMTIEQGMQRAFDKLEKAWAKLTPEMRNAIGDFFSLLRKPYENPRGFTL